MILMINWVEFYVVQGVMYLVEVLFVLEVQIVYILWMRNVREIGRFFSYCYCIGNLFIKNMVGIM